MYCKNTPFFCITVNKITVMKCKNKCHKSFTFFLHDILAGHKSENTIPYRISVTGNESTVDVLFAIFKQLRRTFPQDAAYTMAWDKSADVWVNQCNCLV